MGSAQMFDMTKLDIQPGLSNNISHMGKENIPYITGRFVKPRESAHDVLHTRLFYRKQYVTLNNSMLKETFTFI